MHLTYFFALVFSFVLRIKKKLAYNEIQIELKPVYAGPPPSISHIEDLHFRNMAYLRKAQALLQRPQPYVIAGDSIVHVGEKRFERLRYRKGALKCQGIGADNVSRFLQHYRETIVPLQPEFLALHIGGNDFIGLPESVLSDDYVMTNLDKIFSRLFDEIPTLKKIGYITVIPFGNPEHSVVGAVRDKAEKLNFRNNVAIPRFHKVLQESHWVSKRKVELIDIRNPLIDPNTRYVMGEYGLPDSIHLNDAAYAEVIVPVIDKWFRRHANK